jgi:hypothetical protein
MTKKEMTKQEMTDALYKHLESTVRSITEATPDQLGAWLRQVLQLYKMTKKELRAKFAATFAEMNEPPLKAYRFPYGKITPENVVLDEDDPFTEIIKTADEAYGEGLVMSYYKVPTDDFGDTLASFIAREISSGLAPTGDIIARDYEAAADLMMRASEQLDDVARALEAKAETLHPPEAAPGKIIVPGHAKEDSRPARGGWAPGNYMQGCAVCRDLFVGDKHAVECADCAYRPIQETAILEPKDSVIWVCEKCWPTTNEVLTLGRALSLSKVCDICGYVSQTENDLNPIWKSRIGSVLAKHWEKATVAAPKEPIPKDIQKRINFAFTADSEALDEQIHDMKGNEAANINNKGMKAQIRYLHDEAGMPWSEIRGMLDIKEKKERHA